MTVTTSTVLTAATTMLRTVRLRRYAIRSCWTAEGCQPSLTSAHCRLTAGSLLGSLQDRGAVGAGQPLAGQLGQRPVLAQCVDGLGDARGDRAALAEQQPELFRRAG